MANTLLIIVFLVLSAYVSYCDVKMRKLPNTLLVAMCIVALARAALLHLLVEYVLEALVVGFFFVLFEYVFRTCRKKSALGFGDIKLLCVWAAFMGAFSALLGFAAGLFVGAVVAYVRKEKTFAAGPWISLANALVFFFL